MSLNVFTNDYESYKCYKSGHREARDLASKRHQAQAVLRERRIMRWKMVSLMVRTWWDAERKARCGDVGCAQTIYERLQAALSVEDTYIHDDQLPQPT